MSQRKTTLRHDPSPIRDVDWAPDKQGKQLKVDDVVMAPEIIAGAPARRSVGRDIQEGECFSIKAIWKEGQCCMVALTDRSKVSFKGLRSTLFVKVS